MRIWTATRKALTPREGRIFTSLTDAYCGPDARLPRAADTDAALFVGELVRSSGRVNRLGFRLLLAAVEVAPLLAGWGSRFSSLEPARRAEFLRALDSSRWFLVRIACRLMKTLAVMSYYGDPRNLRACGYDPDAVLARGRALRRSEGRL